MLSVQDLTVSYPGGKAAVRNLSFELSRGQSLALSGENGSGKSTLLFALAGSLPPSGGEFSIGGAHRAAIAVQDLEIHPLSRERYSDAACTARMDEVLGALEVSCMYKDPSVWLSGGEKRAVAIAAAVASEPDLLLLDDPTALMDGYTRRKLMAFLNTLPITKIIATTYDMNFTAQVCQSALIMKDGELFAQGDIQLLYDEDLLGKAGIYGTAHSYDF